MGRNVVHSTETLAKRTELFVQFASNLTEFLFLTVG